MEAADNILPDEDKNGNYTDQCIIINDDRELTGDIRIDRNKGIITHHNAESGEITVAWEGGLAGANAGLDSVSGNILAGTPYIINPNNQEAKFYVNRELRTYTQEVAANAAGNEFGPSTSKRRD